MQMQANAYAATRTQNNRVLQTDLSHLNDVVCVCVYYYLTVCVCSANRMDEPTTDIQNYILHNYVGCYTSSIRGIVYFHWAFALQCIV